MTARPPALVIYTADSGRTCRAGTPLLSPDAYYKSYLHPVFYYFINSSLKKGTLKSKSPEGGKKRQLLGLGSVSSV